MNLATRTISTEKHHNEAKAERFLEQQRCITAMKLLCQLTRAVQHHRGANMAYLGGETLLVTHLQQLQEDIYTILQLLKKTLGSRALSAADLTALNDNWSTIMVGWQQDLPMPNFEFHSHVIDELKKLLRHCREELIPITQQQLQFTQLQRFLLETLFDNIESLSKLRSLCTNAAVIDTCGQDVRSRVSFLLREIPEQNQKIISERKALSAFYPRLSSPEQHSKQDKTLQRLLLSIQIQVLDSTTVTVDGTALFNLATEVISARWKQLGQGLGIVDQSVCDGLIYHTM